MPEAGDDLFVWQERTTDTEPGGGGAPSRP